MGIVNKPIKVINPTDHLTDEKLKELMDPKVLMGLPTGIRLLDQLILGIKPGLYVPSAARGTGKSWFVLQLAKGLWETSKVKTLYFTLEMTVEDLERRCLQSWSNLTEKELLEGKSYDEGLELLREGFIKFVPAYEESFEYNQFESAVESGVANGITFFILDHLHLVPGAHSQTESLQILAEWANNSKQLANRLGITICLIAQPTKGPNLNNTFTKVQSRFLTADDIKGSGAVTDAADVVITISRERDNPKLPPKKECWFSIEKNRLGGKMYEGFSLLLTDTGQFREIDYTQQDAPNSQQEPKENDESFINQLLNEDKVFQKGSN